MVDRIAEEYDLVKLMKPLQMQHVPSVAQFGYPENNSELVESLKKEKGKAFSTNAKQAPAKVKNIKNSEKKEIPEEGFSGMIADGKRSGKASQYYKDGSYFDGFMFEDLPSKGRFYFANGDFYQGAFE